MPQLGRKGRKSPPHLGGNGGMGCFSTAFVSNCIFFWRIFGWVFYFGLFLCDFCRCSFPVGTQRICKCATRDHFFLNPTLRHRDMFDLVDNISSLFDFFLVFMGSMCASISKTPALCSLHHGPKPRQSWCWSVEFCQQISWKHILSHAIECHIHVLLWWFGVPLHHHP